MNNKSNLGIFWGENSFSIVEVKNEQIVNINHIPFDSSLRTEQNQDVPQGLKFTTLLQRAITEQKISSSRVNLALSARDLIFRSFVIPWMQPEEVKSVIDFEATKYVPLKLDELFFTYHAVPFTDNNQKFFRILFVAVRKQVVEDYTGVLEHTGLKIEHIEPASVSLVRILRKQGQLSDNHSNAIIEMGKSGGKIIIVENDVVQFVREFQMPTEENNSSVLNAKLFNDLRVSFNFYSRQNPQGKVDKIITLSIGQPQIQPEELSKELGIPVVILQAEDILRANQISDIGLLSAYGATLRDKTASSKDFELSEKATILQEAGQAAMAQARNYKIMVGLIAFCALAVFLTASLSKKMVSGSKQRLVELEQKQGPFRSSGLEQIESLKTELSNKLTAYQNVHASSDISFFLIKIPAMLPPGTWLKTISINYIDDTAVAGGNSKKAAKVLISLEGYAYLESTNEQFRLVNNLAAQLKNEEDFAKFFTDIDLATVQQENIGEYVATYFRINCK